MSQMTPPSIALQSLAMLLALALTIHLAILHDREGWVGFAVVNCGCTLLSSGATRLWVRFHSFPGMITIALGAAAMGTSACGVDREWAVAAFLLDTPPVALLCCGRGSFHGGSWVECEA